METETKAGIITITTTELYLATNLYLAFKMPNIGFIFLLNLLLIPIILIGGTEYLPKWLENYSKKETK